MKIRELLIIRSLWKNPTYWSKFSPLLDRQVFTDELCSYLFEALQTYYNKYHRSPKPVELRIAVYNTFNLDSKETKLLRSRIRYMINTWKHKLPDLDFVTDQVTILVQQARLRQLAEVSLEEVRSPSPNSLERITNCIENLQKTHYLPEPITDHYNDQLSRYKYLQGREEQAITTGLSELDDSLKGGIYPGEIGILAAPPGRGKSLCLIQMAVAAIEQGKKVLFFTLDDGKEEVSLRFDTRLTMIREAVYLRKLKENAKIKIPLYAKNLKIIDSSSGCRIRDIKSKIIQESEVNLIIIDYADLILPRQDYKDKRFKLGEIYQDLKRLVQAHKIACWTATQTTAKSVEHHKLKLMDAVEAKIEKAGIATIFITINQTPEEQEEGLARLIVVKAKRALRLKQHSTIHILMDETMSLIQEEVYERGVL